MAESLKMQATRRLQQALDGIPSLRTRQRSSPEFIRWHRNAEIAIASTFGKDSRHVKDFADVRYSLRHLASAEANMRAYRDGLGAAASILKSMLDEVGEYWSEDGPPLGSAGEQRVRDTDTDRDKVFIIHGRDEGAKEAVARLLATLGLSPVILHEQPNLGRTLIEKFEGHAQVGFAVALLTPDDVGALRGKKDALSARARQNVIFEFGYFIGRLGRQRVCALTKGDVELPSDYEGIVYIPLDDGGAWRIALVKELRAAGFQVDANLAL